MQFLSLAQSKKIKTTLRQVIIPTLNDNAQNIARLNDIALSHPNVDGVELLPFKKICQVKYDSLGIDFAFKNFSTPTPESIEQLSKLIKI
jgi:pyruvate formate lyase activating enzyme